MFALPACSWSNWLVVEHFSFKLCYLLPLGRQSLPNTSSTGSSVAGAANAIANMAAKIGSIVFILNFDDRPEEIVYNGLE